MLTQIVTTKLEIAKVAACDQTGLATRAKLVHFSLDSDACFIDADSAIFDIDGGESLDCVRVTLDEIDQ